MERNMKKFILSVVVMLSVLLDAVALDVAGDVTVVQLCYSLTQCSNLINCNTADKCCCPNGNTKTTYNCPSGWSWNSSDNLCERSDSSSSNSYGYYTITYGTCDYTSTTVSDCYGGPVLRSSLETGEETECFCPCTSLGA